MKNRSSTRLTEARVKALRPGANVVCLWDSVVPGFHTRVYPSGTKGYAVRFQRPDGSKVVVNIGSASVFSVEAAREEARKLRQLHDNGVDARAHQMDKRNAKDMTALVDLWKEHYRDLLKPSTRRSHDSIIKCIVLPALGSRLVKDLDRPAINDLYRKERKSHPTGANRAIEVISRLMSIAEAEGWRPLQTNPCYRFPKIKEVPCNRVLSAAELFRLELSMSKLEGEGKLDQIAADLIRFLALSGLRTGEAHNLCWSDINLENNTMIIIDHKTSQSMGAKVLPLNQPLREILRRRAAARLGSLVFPGMSGRGPIKGLRKMWLRILAVDGCNLDGVTPHDLRRTFSTTCSDLGYPAGTGDTLLGHSLGRITDTYRRLPPDGILATASNDTAAWLAAAMRGEKVKNGERVAVHKLGHT